MAIDTSPIEKLNAHAAMGSNADIVDEVMWPDFVDHDPLPGTGGREGQRALFKMVQGAFSDRKLDRDEMIETADGRIVEYWTMSAKFTGEFMGIPPSNKPVAVSGIEIWKIAGGKIAERWGVVDMSALMGG